MTLSINVIRDNLLVTLFLMSTISLMIPYGFPIFSILCLGTFIFCLAYGKLAIRFNWGLVLLALIMIFYLWGVIHTGRLYSTNKGEIVNIILTLMLVPVIGGCDSTSFKNILRKFGKCILPICFIIALVSLYKFYLMLNGVLLDFIYDENSLIYPQGTSLVTDYNMYSLSMLIGILSWFSLPKLKTSFLHQFFIANVIHIVFISIILSGSRRAWVIILLIVAIIFLKLLSAFFSINRRQSRHSILLLLYFIVLYSVLFSFITDSINFENLNVTKLLYRFDSIGAQEGFTPRTERWEFIVYLLGDYNLFEIFFGKGFSYLVHYAQGIGMDVGEDHPHNFILAALLYSGVVGGLFVVTFILYTFYALMKHYQSIDKGLISFYLLVLLYIMISGNSLFSLKLFMFLILLIIQYPELQRR